MRNTYKPTPQKTKHKFNQTNYQMMSVSPPDTPTISAATMSGEPRYGEEYEAQLPEINFETDKFPYCIVWTPIPVLTWLLPMIGHMGICMSNGVIRDFAGPYFVSENDMAFGRPARYLRLNPNKVQGGGYEWDESVSKASVLYGTRMHNLFCDNCHSHVATALCGMRYKNSTSWNMLVLAFWMFFCGRYVGIVGFLKTWIPFLIVLTLCVLLAVYF